MRLYLLFFKNTKGLNTLVFFSLLLELYVLKYFFCSAYELIYFIPVQNYTNMIHPFIRNLKSDEFYYQFKFKRQ